MTKTAKKIKLEQSALPSMVIEPFSKNSIDASEAFISKYYIAAFTAVANYLAMTKSKAGKTVLSIKDEKGNLLIAGIVEYHEAVDENSPANWTFEFTFDDEDIKDAAHETLATDSQFQEIFKKTLDKLFGLKFGDSKIALVTMEIAMKTLKTWLLENADEEETTLVLDGTFEATAGIEDKEKVISLTPSGDLKEIIKKNDGDTEVSA